MTELKPKYSNSTSQYNRRLACQLVLQHCRGSLQHPLITTKRANHLVSPMMSTLDFSYPVLITTHDQGILKSFNNINSKQQSMIKLLRVRSLSLTRKGWVRRWWNSSLAERRQLLRGKTVALEMAHLGSSCNHVGASLRRPWIHLEHQNNTITFSKIFNRHAKLSL